MRLTPGSLRLAATKLLERGRAGFREDLGQVSISQDTPNDPYRNILLVVRMKYIIRAHRLMERAAERMERAALTIQDLEAQIVKLEFELIQRRVEQDVLGVG